MSKLQIDSDGFQTVKSKRTSKIKQTHIPRNDIQLFQNKEIEIDCKKAISRIREAIEDLRLSTYFEGVKTSVNTILECRQVVEIICFGLGHISECNISRYQLAFLLCLQNICNCQRVLVHDPIFYKDECSILRTLGLEIIKENKEGCYIISDKSASLVYLPHCPKQLTNNFLWSNWTENIENCILLCNSFSSLIENQPSRIVSETVPYIHRIYPHIEEIPIKNSFKFTDIFNDTSIHHFPKENLEKLNSEFWLETEKPTYEGGIMATIKSKPTLITLRLLLSEIRKQSSTRRLVENQMVRYIFNQYRKYQTTDQQLCKAIDEMHFKAQTYYNYLHNTRRYKEINAEFKGKGERSVDETARMVGFKLPQDPKP